MGEFRYVGTQYLIARGEAALRETVAEGLKLLLELSRAETPVDTGDLQDSLEIDGPHGGGGYIYGRVQSVGIPYAVFVHEGTGPHIIMPRKEGGWLYFDGHFAKVVHHPGTPAFKFLEHPLLFVRDDFIAAAAAAMRAAF